MALFLPTCPSFHLETLLDSSGRKETFIHYCIADVAFDDLIEVLEDSRSYKQVNRFI